MTVPPTVEEALVSRLRELESSIQAVWEDESALRVHAARVASRKVEAAIYLCQDSLCQKDVEFYFRRCRRLRTATNTLRDCDVLLKRLGKQTALPSEKCQESLTRLQHRSRQRLRRRLSRWCKRDKLAAHRQHIFGNDKPVQSEGLSARILQLAGEFMVVALDLPTTDRNVHRLRIATKELRYGFDFLLDCGFQAYPSACGEKLEQLQTQLGVWTDEIKHRQLLDSGNHLDMSPFTQESLEQRMLLVERIVLCAFEAARWSIIGQLRLEQNKSAAVSI